MVQEPKETGDAFLEDAGEPRTPAAQPPPAQRVRGRREAEARAAGWETVLLVEEDQGVRDLVREFLGKQGYRVLAATGGGQALQLAEQHPEPIHLLITNLVMTGMSGRELVYRVTAQRRGMRVLYVSGHTQDAALLPGVQHAGAMFLAKPFALSAFVRKVRELLAGAGPLER